MVHCSRGLILIILAWQLEAKLETESFHLFTETRWFMLPQASTEVSPHMLCMQRKWPLSGECFQYFSTRIMALWVHYDVSVLSRKKSACTLFHEGLGFLRLAWWLDVDVSCDALHWVKLKNICNPSRSCKTSF